MTFGAFASKNFNVIAEYKPVSGAYRQLRVEASGVVQSGIDGDPESDEVRVAFTSNNGEVTRYYIEDIVWLPRKRGGTLYRDNGVLISEQVRAASTYVPLVADFYTPEAPGSLLPEGREIAEVVFEAGWMSDSVYRDPATREFLALESLECAYYSRWWQTAEMPLAVVFLYWLLAVLFNRDVRGPLRLYVTRKGLFFRRANDMV